MTNPSTDTLALAERVEAADVWQQSDLLAEAWRALNPEPPKGGTYSPDDKAWHSHLDWIEAGDRFSELLALKAFESAAFMLIDADTFFHISRFDSECDGRSQAHVYPNRFVGDDYQAEAATPALALCAAALRAHAERTG